MAPDVRAVVVFTSEPDTAPDIAAEACARALDLNRSLRITHATMPSVVGRAGRMRLAPGLAPDHPYS